MKSDDRRPDPPLPTPESQIRQHLYPDLWPPLLLFRRRHTGYAAHHEVPG